MRRTKDDPGVMTLGLGALGAFMLVGTIATLILRDDLAPAQDDIPFSAPAAEQQGDSAPGPVITGYLPARIGESSGIAHSRRNADIWWTHNDGGDGRVYAIREDGTLVATWRLKGIDLDDVEDIAAARCPDGGAACLYLADTGDNDRDRDDYAVYIVEEPDLMASGNEGELRLVAVERFDYDGDTRDSEALAVLPDGSMIVITKGQEEGAEMFRLPEMGRALPGAPNRPVAAESLGMLPIDADRKKNRVTGAAVSPSGNVLAVRSDRDVTLFSLPGKEELARCAVEAEHGQGESVDFVDEHTLLLTYESSGGRAPIVRVPCGA